MNKKFAALFLLPLLLTSACSGLALPIPEEPQNTTGFVKSSQNREISPLVDPDLINHLVKDNNAFALAFYNLINADEDNIVFSPLSLSLALSMTLAGAKSTTEQGMIDALNLSLPVEDLYSAFNALLLAIEESQQTTINDYEGDSFQLNIANSIWGQTGYPLKESFLDTLSTNFDAGVHLVDFVGNPDGAYQAINYWIEEETEEKIKELIPQDAITAMTRMVLANAIYFNASWLYPFNKSATEKAPFTLLNGDEINVDMMKLSNDGLYYAQVDRAQALELPYLSSDFSMTLIIPDEGYYSDFEKNLDIQQLDDILNEMGKRNVYLQMPKFDLSTTTDARQPLIRLGMADAFDMQKADFTGMTEENELFISDVLHKATIIMDEQGTEAAAASAVIMGIKAMMPEEPVDLVINRPFMFFIRHLPTNSIIFMGRVTHP